MKPMRLVCVSMAVLSLTAWAIAAAACDKKTSTASAATNAACSQMSAAECQAKMGAGHTCPVHGATTAAMTGSTCPHASAVTASAGAPACAGHNVNAMTVANGGQGSAHGASAMTAASECAGHNARTTAYARGLCPEHNVSAMAAGLGSNCTSHANATGFTAHVDCDACDDLAACDAELQAAGASMQTVPIKNGVMFVYTADAPGRVNAIQSVMARRTEHLSRIVASGTQAKLCDDCKSMRGAMASGRLVREVVNIEGGTLVLVTSNDPVMVKRIRALADAGKTAVKS